MPSTRRLLSTPQKRPRKGEEDESEYDDVNGISTPDIFASPKVSRKEEDQVEEDSVEIIDVDNEEKEEESVKVKSRKKDVKVKSLRSLRKKLEFNLVDKVKEEEEEESKRSGLSQEDTVKAVYAIIQSRVGNLGGNGSGGEIYGELTKASFQRVLEILVDKCELTSDSVFLDIGSGLGKPNFHAAAFPGVKLSLGLEIQGTRWWQSINLLHNLLDDEDTVDCAKKCFFLHANVMDVKTFDPVTHVYCFNRGIPGFIMKLIAASFNKSKVSKYFICFDRLGKLEGFGFKLKLIETQSCSMHGSGEGHLCYIYEKLSTSTPEMKMPVFTKISRSEWSKLLLKTPQHERYTPCVKHAKNYSSGFLSFSTNSEKYKEWVWDQIGFDSEDRCGRTLRIRPKKTDRYTS